MHPLPIRSGAAAALVASSLLAASCGSTTHASDRGPAASHPSASSTTSTSRAAPSRTSLSASTEPWTLQYPVSRPVVLPDGSELAILGGLATGDVSTSRIATVDTASGRETVAGQLDRAVHDSAGAVLNGHFYTFGGGSSTTIATVQEWAGAAGAATSEPSTLPAPRSDLSAVTVGGTAYVAGGFNGTDALDPDVLATTDGTSFRTVAHLAVPVRYAAIAASGGNLWLFGGVTGTAEGSTEDTDVIQEVALSSGQARVVGHLPIVMGHATAVVLGGHIFVVGGRSGSTPSAAILGFDPATGTTYNAGTLPQPVSDCGSAVIGSTGYLVGGEVEGPDQPLATVVALTTT